MAIPLKQGTHTKVNNSTLDKILELLDDGHSVASFRTGNIIVDLDEVREADTKLSVALSSILQKDDYVKSDCIPELVADNISYLELYPAH